MIKRLSVYIISLILIVCLVQPAYADNEAVDYSSSCTYASGGNAVLAANLTDVNVESRVALNGGSSLEMSWDASVPVERIFYELTTVTSDLKIDFFDRNGTHIEEKNVNAAFLSAIIDLPNGTCALTLTSSTALSVATLRAFGSGALPSFCHEWEQTPDKLDYLIIAAHPDDETRCMGGAIAVQSGRTGNVLFVTSRNRTSVAAGLNAVWSLGLNYHPVFGSFRSKQNTVSEKDALGYWDEDEVLTFMVQNIRSFKPDVVVTHGVDGEGDGQHIITSRLVRLAVEKAADSDFNPASADELGVWSVKKLYLHSLNGSGLVLNTDEQINGRIMAANACYLLEANDADTTPKLDGDGNVFTYELVHSVVGEDKEGDMFSNLTPVEAETSAAPQVVDEPSKDAGYSDDFSSPIPVSEPTPGFDDGLRSAEPTEGPIVKAEVEDSEHDAASQQGKKKSIWLIGAGALLSLLLFVFTFRWFRYSKNTVIAILICLLPLFFMVAAYLLIVNSSIF